MPVRFVVAARIADIEVFAYIQTADYDEFLQLQQTNKDLLAAHHGCDQRLRNRACDSHPSQRFVFGVFK